MSTQRCISVDRAAGMVPVQEAGGAISSLTGEPPQLIECVAGGIQRFGP
ncbi:hypothetical protein ABDB91_02365 [Desulfoscipio sp. XC116]